MALKDIFKMTKANRYTADGREELIKAQEAETEDRRYNIGEISEKTGLQKTANGWVKPKNGNAGSAKKDASGADILNNKYYKNDVRTEEGEKKILSETKTEVLENKVKDLENLKQKNGGKLGVQGEKSLQLAKAELESRKTKTSESKPAGSTSAPKTIKFEDAEKAVKNGQVVQWQDRDGNWNDIDPKTSELIMAKSMGSKLRVKTDTDGNPVMQKPDPTKNEVRSKLLELEKRRKKFEKYPEEDNDIRLQQASLLSKAGFSSRKEFDDFVKSEMPTDSAPRVLTGDTRIRVRK